MFSHIDTLSEFSILIMGLFLFTHLIAALSNDHDINSFAGVMFFLVAGSVILLDKFRTGSTTQAELWVIIGVCLLSISLLSLLFMRKFFNQNSKISKKQYPKIPVINILRHRKSTDSKLAIIYIEVAIIIYILLSQVYEEAENMFIIIVLFSGILIVSLNKIILQYRIYKGLYANNRREAEEIIQFILDESSNIDFTDDGQAKKIMSNQDIQEIQKRIAGELSGNPIPA